MARCEAKYFNFQEESQERSATGNLATKVSYICVTRIIEQVQQLHGLCLDSQIMQREKTTLPNLLYIMNFC